MTFELLRKTRSVFSVGIAEKDLVWTFYIIEREGRRFLIPRSPRGGERNDPEFKRLQSEATAFATAQARRLNWID